MCGIGGIVRFDLPGHAFAARLGPMRARLRHRGPDGEGEAITSHAALVHTRLAMVDAAGGAQPFKSADGRYTLVYNGELYNDAELRAELPGPFRTRCDTETLLAAWQRWGKECLLKLDGMFAFFLWDEELQCGFAARDRLGVKPFAYAVDKDEFRFASEARAIVEGRARPNLDAVIEQLVAPCFSGVSRSAFAGVEYLQPAQLLIIDRGGIALERYWHWSARSEEVPAASLREAFIGGVRGALRSDAPLGVFLSGGLDSTAIAALAREAGVALPAFTIAYEGQGEWAGGSVLVMDDDGPHARAAAKELGLAQREVLVPRDSLASEIAALGAVNDAIPAWEQELSQRALARAASREVKGVLVGDAADETHYGYHFLLDEIASAAPAAILQRLGSVPIRPEADPMPARRLDAEYRALASSSGLDFADPTQRIAATTQLIIERWLPRLLHNGDIHTMRFGLEARVPFAATKLVELAARIAPDLALSGGAEKAVLRESLRGLLPESIRTRRKSALPKDQNALPIYQSELLKLLNRELHPLVRGVVDLPLLKPLLHAPRASEQERAQLFRVLALHHWATANEVTWP